MKRALSPFFFAAAVASVLNCGGGGREESFSSDGDTKVMAGVTGIWMGSTADGKTYTLTLCENLAATHADGNACDTLHVVRGDGRGTTETTEEPTGCGGCDYSYSAFVSGTIEGDDLASTTVHGEFDLATGDASGLGLPYQFDAISDAKVTGQYNESTPAVALNGHVEQAGIIEISRFVYPPLGAVTNDAGGDSETDSGADSAADSAAPPPSDIDGSAQGSGSQITAPGFEMHRIGEASCASQ